MILKVYAVRDSKAEAFLTPFYQKTHGEAERSFKELTNEPKSFVSKYPEDFDLYYLGEYEDITGTFNTLDTPQHVAKAVQLMNQKQ